MQKRQNKSNIFSNSFFQKNIIKSFRFTIPPFVSMNCYLDENPFTHAKGRINRMKRNGFILKIFT